MGRMDERMFLLEMLMDGFLFSFVFFVMEDLDWFDNASGPGDSRNRARRVLFVASILYSLRYVVELYLLMYLACYKKVR